MRFGKRHKFKPRGNGESSRGGGIAATAVALSSDESAFPAEETNQRGNARGESDLSSRGTSLNEPTQQVLEALARFNRELPDARGNTHPELWADACMNELIACVEIAIEQRWPDFAKPLTDTGRILQTYENAGSAERCIPFMTEAHEILSLMISDLIIGTIRPEANEKWNARYQNALDAIHAAGLTLVQDDQDVSPSEKEGGAVEQERAYDATEPVHEQQKMPLEIVSSSPAKWSESEELPALDDLPPLEELPEMGIEVSADSINDEAQPEQSEPPPQQTEQADLLSSLENVTYLDTGSTARRDQSLDNAPDDTSAEPPETDSPDSTQGDDSPETEPPVSEPGRMVIEILDRLCDELGQVSSLSDDERGLSIERITGGISALKREAENCDFTIAGKLCESMEQAGELALSVDSPPDQRYIELGYAFCGVYTEATGEYGSPSVEAWENECQGLIDELNSEASTAEATEEASDTQEAEPPPQIDDAVIERLEAELEAAQITLEPTQESEEEDEQQSEAASELGQPGCSDEPPETDAHASQDEAPSSLDALVTPVSDESEDERVHALESEPEPEPEPPQEVILNARADEPSRSFLESAQRADSAGDTARAKYFALQAAAEIAKEEVASAERQLHEAEVQLRGSWKAAEDARKQVKEGENEVVRAATEVVTGETSLGTAREGVAQAIQEHEGIEAHVQELQEQINDLQARFAMENEKLETAARFRGAAGEEEEKAKQRLEELTRREADARMALETTRQEVKNLHRATNDIESNMEQAREILNQKKNSMGGIDQIIEQLCGREKPGENPDTLLF